MSRLIFILVLAVVAFLHPICQGGTFACRIHALVERVVGWNGKGADVLLFGRCDAVCTFVFV